MAEQPQRQALPARHDVRPSHHSHGKRRRAGPSNRDSRRGRPRRSPATKPAPPCCSQCDKLDPKYKCPKCRIAYCSVQCCRAHKEKGCQPLEVTTATSKYLPSNVLVRDVPQNATPRQEQHEDDNLEEGWKITDKMKTAMDASDWLKKELQDGGLRQIIHGISSVSDTVAHGGKTHRELALEEAKRNYPNFETFIDKLLVLTGVLERQETQDDVNQWLEGDKLGPLALVPIPRQKRQRLNTPNASCSTSDSEKSESDESESSDETSSSDSEDDSQ